MSSPELLLSPIRKAHLKDLSEVEPINEGDEQCLAEIRDVLKKYGMQERFGVFLLHKHFDLAADEVLIEDNDPQTRMLTIKPVKREEALHTQETMWAFVGEDLERVCPHWCQG
jgi:hypothetical protein